MRKPPGRLLLPNETGALEEVPVSGRVSFDNAAINTTVNAINPFDGVMLYLVQMNVQMDLQFTAADCAEPKTFTSASLIHGHVAVQPAGVNNAVPMTTGHVTVTNPRERWMQMDIATGQSAWLATTVSPAAIEALGLGTGNGLIGDLMANNRNSPVLTDVAGGVRLRHVQHDLAYHPYSGPLRDMYLQAKAMEYITLQMASVDAHATPMPSGHAIRHKIYEARDRLIADLGNPPGLPELAREVGLSVHDLTGAFRREFGQTPFAYLRDYRLDIARVLLAESDRPLKQIAYQAGYKHLSNFVTAFRRRFNMSPGQYRKQN